MIGKKLRELRKEKNLTQIALAQQIGVSNSLICDIEAGRTTPSVRTLLRLAKVLGVEPSIFFDKASRHSV